MVLIDMEGVNYLDLEGSDMLKEIAENMKGAAIEIHLARVKHEVMEMLKKDGVDLIIGGHTHTFLKKPTVVRNRADKNLLVNQVGCWGVQVGRIDFEFNSRGKSSEKGTSIVV